MCGRYVLYGPHSRYREQFGIDDLAPAPSFNIGPGRVLPVIRRGPDGGRRVVLARWGLLPSWVKDPADRHQPINAKAETVAVLPMFRSAFRKSRVLVPADGFYEWRALAGAKQPYFIRRRDGASFAMAGLLEHWRGPAGDVASFAIVTTPANALLAAIHDRMPAIIAPADYEAWLEPTTDAAALQALLVPCADESLEAYAVDRRVNRPDQEGPELIAPLAQP